MAKKLKLPKRIAGIKIPKAIRKGPVGKFINSPAGQLVVAEALVAAAGVFTAKKVIEGSDARDVAKHPAESIRRVVKTVADSGQDQAERLTFALKEAAKAFKTAMENGPASELTEAPFKGEPELSAKKKTLSRRESGTVPH
jgi:hypothetical protein